MLIPLGLLGIVGAAILQRGEWLIVCALLTGIGFNLWAASHLNDSVWISMIAFLGFGLLLASLFDPTEKNSWRQGLTLIALSAGLFCSSVANCSCLSAAEFILPGISRAHRRGINSDRLVQEKEAAVTREQKEPYGSFCFSSLSQAAFTRS